MLWLCCIADGQRKHDFSHKSTPGLLASNSIQTVRETTRAAFAIYGDQHYYVDAIRKLQELEGVSFPIATLLLAEYDPVNIPYFTEGLYRWVREEDSREGSWDRKIDYIMKQYRVLMERVAQLRGRFREDSGADVTALQVEKVARQVMVFAEERRRKHPEEDIFLFKPPAPKKRKLDTPQGSPPVEHQSAPVTENERPPVTESERTLFTQIERAPATEIGRTPVAENERAPKTKTKKVSLTWPTLKDSEAINDGRWRPY